MVVDKTISDLVFNIPIHPFITVIFLRFCISLKIRFIY
jgi:hypothetical protein